MDAHETPGPGIYPDVPAAEYHLWPYASNSRLGLLVPPSTPAKLKAALDEPPKDKAVFKQGRALHACVLEPDVYARDFQPAGMCQATIKSGARCSKPGNWPVVGGGSVCTTHLNAKDSDWEVDDTRVLVSEADDWMARRCRESFAAHEIAAGFLSCADAQRELSLVWDDPTTGVRCKARLDWYSPTMMGGLPMDLKGARSAAEYEFTKQAVYNGYLRQSVLYRMGLHALGLPATTFAAVAQEKEAPYDLVVYLMGDEATGPLPQQGEEPVHVARLVTNLLRLWDRCHQTGIYPGYERRVHTMTTPEWAWHEMDRQSQAIEDVLSSGRIAA